jgi:5-methylcytosine-specific restriction protein A
METALSPFVPGKKYHRVDEIHSIYGGQRQSGISTPAKYPMIFIFTGDSGALYGYEDGFKPDGTFWYTGEGQVGHMTMTKGNRAIRDHQEIGKTIHLFEYVGTGIVRYVGEASYLGHHIEQRPDINRALRNAIIFELSIDAPGISAATEKPAIKFPEAPQRLWTIPMNELESLATQSARDNVTSAEKKAKAFQRSESVRVYVLRRANGKCDACNNEAPFITKQNRPYLEPHHILRLTDGGPDNPRSVAALCPNCHREAHHGKGAEELNQRLLKQLDR